MMIKIKRIYEKANEDDGYRVLVDRLWPRGLSKDESAIDLWMKEIGPTTALRKWFNHEPAKWSNFRGKYLKELKAKQHLIEKIAQLEVEKGTVTLLYAAKNEHYNQAVILGEFIASNCYVR
jgi:uncharacterized protein YeaO (DUF488 family)